MRWLTSRFRSFGPLRYARITVDKATGRSRGTGFVCFWNVEHADAAIEEAQKVASETGANAMPVSRDELYPREPRTDERSLADPATHSLCHQCSLPTRLLHWRAAWSFTGAR